MPTTPHGFRYPSPLDGRAVPDDLMKLAEDVDEHAVYVATDSADRDARFSDIEPGLIVTSPSTGQVWMRLATGWLTIYADTGWVETGFTPAQDFTKGGYMRISRLNGWVELRAEVVYGGTNPITAAGPTDSAPGNIPDTLVLTVPAQFAPGGDGSSPIGVAWRSYLSGGNGSLSTAGNLYLTDMHTSSKISNGDFVRLSAVYRQG